MNVNSKKEKSNNSSNIVYKSQHHSGMFKASHTKYNYIPYPIRSVWHSGLLLIFQAYHNKIYLHRHRVISECSPGSGYCSNSVSTGYVQAPAHCRRAYIFFPHYPCLPVYRVYAGGGHSFYQVTCLVVVV